jgi:hypothetical protein
MRLLANILWIPSPLSRRFKMEGYMRSRCLKPVTTTEETQAGAENGAGLSIICRNTDAQAIADIQTDGFAPRY